MRNKIVLQKIIVIKTKDRVGNKERKIFLKKLLTANHMNVLSKKPTIIRYKAESIK